MIAFIRDSPTTICTRFRATHVPEQSRFGMSENILIANLSDVAFWIQTDCGDDWSPTYRRVCRNVDVSAVSDARFYRRGSEELQPTQSGSSCGPPMIQFISLGKENMRIRSL